MGTPRGMGQSNVNVWCHPCQVYIAILRTKSHPHVLIKACHFFSIRLGIVVRGTDCHATKQCSIPYRNKCEWVYCHKLDPNTCSRSLFMVWQKVIRDSSCDAYQGLLKYTNIKHITVLEMPSSDS